MISQYTDAIIPIAIHYNLKAVYLFGSYARNNAHNDSDIDIIVDTEGSTATSLFKLGALYEDLHNALNKEIDLMTLKSLIEYENDPYSRIISSNIRKDMVPIYERERSTITYAHQ